MKDRYRRKVGRVTLWPVHIRVLGGHEEIVWGPMPGQEKPAKADEQGKLI